jgi:hypothetical protein
MAEQMGNREVVTFEELLRSCVYEQEAIRRVLVRKGLLSSEELLSETKAVRHEIEARRAK